MLKIRKYLGKYKFIQRLNHIIFYFHPRYFFSDTLKGYKKWNTIMPIFISKEMKIRIDMLKTLNQKKDVLKISNEGFAILDSQVNLLKPAVDVALKIMANSGIYHSDYNQLKSEYKKPFLCVQKIDLNADNNAPIKKIITSSEILLPVANYLNHIPILANAQLLYSPNKEMEDGRSQQWHLDGGDGKNIKVFIALEDINKDQGPFTFITKSLSNSIYKSLYNLTIVSKRNYKVSDENFYHFCKESDVIVGTMKKNTAIFIDTDSCYHYGSRPAHRPRMLLELEYRLAFSRDRNFSLFDRKYLKGNFNTLSNDQKIEKLVFDSRF
mgnify:FL=1